ncbi:hypothetical protein J4442_01595 [Candidatus Woesearchaeota archaeon]|nr:hypothetical protein [Candidatus Woesearchaeota archaeon]
MSYLKPVIDEIYMPHAILALAHPHALATGSNDIERLTDSYDYLRERAIFDYVADDTSDPIREFAFNMARVVPYNGYTCFILQLYNVQDWDLISKSLLLKRKEVNDAIRGREVDNFEDIIRCELTHRDYLLELMIRSVEKHSRQHKSSPSRIFFDN